MANQDGKGFRGPRPQYLIKDEITEYFSRDIEFDWPESYTPRYPLTDGERKLQVLNATGVSPAKWLEGKLKLVVREELDRSPDKESDVP